MNRRILDTEVFSRLDITPKPDGENTLALDITGEEAPRKRVAAYVGYQTFNGPIVGVEGRIVNFLGTGDTAGASAEYSGIGLAGSLKWINPAFVNSPWSLNVDLTAQSLEPFGYREETVGAHASFSRKWNRHATASVFTGIDSTKDTSGLLTLLELGPSDYRVAKAGASFTLDYRNSAVLPTKGWLIGGTLTDGFGVGGLDLNYLRTDLNFAFYQPITKRLRAAVQARVSALQSSADVVDIPIDLRLFNGGATTVRSFAERELGLEASDGTPLGGKVTHVFNAELSYEIVENLELATFADAGNLVRDSNSIASLHDMRYAVGLGIRYKLPFGPLRVDYGFNPSRREGEKVGALHITFGFAF